MPSFYGLEKLTAAAHRASRAIRHPSAQAPNHQGLVRQTKAQLKTTWDSCVSGVYCREGGMGSFLYVFRGRNQV